MTEAASKGKSGRRRPPDGSLLVFVHIRKTAGMTVRRILHRQYRGGRHVRRLDYFTNPERCVDAIRSLTAAPPPQLRVVHGHILFFPDIWPPDTRFFTIMRDPVARTISHYTWLVARDKLQQSLAEAVSRGVIRDNVQTRVLAGSYPRFGATTDEMLERALESLDRFSVVGLTERFDESLVLLTRTFGWRRMLYESANVTPRRMAPEEIEPETIEVIERHNALDLALYRRARERFELELAKVGEDFRIEVAALQRANARFASFEPKSSLQPLPPRIGTGDGSLDLRELLIDAQSDLLIREALFERSKEWVDEEALEASRSERRELEDRLATLESKLRQSEEYVVRLQAKLSELRGERARDRPAAQPIAAKAKGAKALRRGPPLDQNGPRPRGSTEGSGMHWVEVQRRAKESANGAPTEADKAAVRETYYRHERELSNPESRRLFEAWVPELDEAQQDVLGRLRRDGIAVLPFTELFDESLWSRLAADSAEFAQRAIREIESGKPGKEKKEKKPKPGKVLSPEKLARMQAKAAGVKKKFVQIRQFKGGPELTLESPWLEFAGSPRIVDVVNTYLGLWTKVSYIDEWYTAPSSSEAERLGSQRWHRDYNDQHLIKAFLYMSDVDEGSGPFEYVLGSVDDGPYGGDWPWEPLGDVYPPPDEFAQRIPASAVRTNTAPRGTLILCNTSGFHRGGFCTERPRTMGVVNYVSPAGLAALVQRNFRVDPSALPPSTSEAVRFAFA